MSIYIFKSAPYHHQYLIQGLLVKWLAENPRCKSYVHWVSEAVLIKPFYMNALHLSLEGLHVVIL